MYSLILVTLVVVVHWVIFVSSFNEKLSGSVSSTPHTLYVRGVLSSDDGVFRQKKIPDIPNNTTAIFIGTFSRTPHKLPVDFPLAELYNLAGGKNQFLVKRYPLNYPVSFFEREVSITRSFMGQDGFVQFIFASYPFLFFEWIDGIDLLSLASNYDFDLNSNLAMYITAEVARLIKICHKNGVIHMDLKPENVIVSFQPFKLKLIDFGTALWISSIEAADKNEVIVHGRNTVDRLLTMIRPTWVYSRGYYMVMERQRIMKNLDFSFAYFLRPEVDIYCLISLLLRILRIDPDAQLDHISVDMNHSLIERLNGVQYFQCHSTEDYYLRHYCQRKPPTSIIPGCTKKISDIITGCYMCAPASLDEIVASFSQNGISRLLLDQLQNPFVRRKQQLLSQRNAIHSV